MTGWLKVAATKVFIQSAGLTVREEVNRKVVTNFVSTPTIVKEIYRDDTLREHSKIGKQKRFLYNQLD